MCDFAVDLREHGGWSRLSDARERIAPLAEDGLAVIDGPRIAIPEAARPFARLVAQAFDAYAPIGAARHSRAV